MNNEPVAWRTHYPSGWEYKDGNPPFELKVNSQLLYTHPAELTDEEINVVAILQDAEIVPVGHEIWKTGEEFNKYKRIVLATAKALRKASEK